MLVRFLPLIGMAFFLAVNLIRVLVQRRRTGGTGIMLFRTPGWTNLLRDAVHVGILVVTLGQAILYAARPETLAMTSPVPLPVAEPWPTTAATLLLGGVMLMSAAQFGMGKSWRIGIEPGARPGLVTGGIYRFSRNPIYVGTTMALAGFTVLMPTWISLVLLVLTLVRVRWQVGLEEAYLVRTYGDEYLAYARTVGRFVPGLGRLG